MLSNPCVQEEEYFWDCKERDYRKGYTDVGSLRSEAGEENIRIVQSGVRGKKRGKNGGFISYSVVDTELRKKGKIINS